MNIGREWGQDDSIAFGARFSYKVKEKGKDIWFVVKTQIYFLFLDFI